MHSFEKIVTAGREAEHFTTAVYRFLETRVGSDSETALVILSEPLGGRERKVVTLWSEAAVTDFERFWNSFQLDRPIGLPPAPAKKKQTSFTGPSPNA
jgi:hypothetical protein